MRRSTVRSVAATVIAAICATGLMTAAGATSRKADAAESVRAGTLLTNTTFGRSTQLNQIDMISTSLGYALVSSAAGKSHWHYDLVRTTDEGRRWHVVGLIPSYDGRYPTLSDTTFDSDPQIEFTSASVGYVDGPGGSIYVTRNGGGNWTQIIARDTFSSYAVSGNRVSVVTMVCNAAATFATTKCVSLLREFAVGGVHPLSSHVIPPNHPMRPQSISLLGAAPGGVVVINRSSDSEAKPAALDLTRNGGATWTTLTNPCTGFGVSQLLVVSASDWLLNCFLDGGMSQGVAQIFRTSNDGATWTTVVDDTPTHDLVGDLGDTPTYLFASDEGRVLFAAFQNPAGGLSVSTDGGRDWSRVEVMGGDGGAPEWLSNISSTTATFQILDGPVYVTHNLRTWAVVPELPAGRYRGMRICTATTTRARLYRTNYGGSETDFVDFTNHSSRSCYLDGAPDVQPLNATGGAVGPTDATEVNGQTGDFVVLRPHGGVANVLALLGPSSSFPRKQCEPVRATSIRVSFGAPSRFRVRLGRFATSACTLTPSWSFGDVVRGRK